MKKINVGVTGAPSFKLTALSLAMAAAVATCSFEPVQAEAVQYDWLANESDPLLREFDRLQVSRWDEDTVFTLDHEQYEGMEIFALTADDCPFSFRKLDDQYTITYSGEHVQIQPETYQYFANSCLELKAFLMSEKNN